MGVRSWEANLYSREQEWRERAEKAEAEVERLRAAIREAIIEIDEARDYVEGTDLARETLVRALTDTKGE